jgi:hypothetical protein
MDDDRELTEEEKKAECQRICGDFGKRGMHVQVPVLCPILWDVWRGLRKNRKRVD